MTAQPDTTTIRVTTDTRKRLNDALKEDSRFKSIDELIVHLLMEDFKQAILADWQRYWDDQDARLKEQAELEPLEKMQTPVED